MATIRPFDQAEADAATTARAAVVEVLAARGAAPDLDVAPGDVGQDLAAALVLSARDGFVDDPGGAAPASYGPMDPAGLALVAARYGLDEATAADVAHGVIDTLEQRDVPARAAAATAPTVVS